MMWKVNKGAIAENFNELGLGTIRQKNEGPLCKKYLKCPAMTPLASHHNTISLPSQHLILPHA